MVPSESKYELLKTKVEIRLKKAAPISWPTLEKSKKKIAANFSDPALEQPPSYPSSFTKYVFPFLSHLLHVFNASGITACGHMQRIALQNSDQGHWEAEAGR